MILAKDLAADFHDLVEVRIASRQLNRTVRTDRRKNRVALGEPDLRQEFLGEDNPGRIANFPDLKLHHRHSRTATLNICITRGADEVQPDLGYLNAGDSADEILKQFLVLELVDIKAALGQVDGLPSPELKHVA